MDTTKKAAHKTQINRAFSYLKAHLSEKISLTELAAESGTSQYHFIRIFNAYTGETPFSFLRRERIVQSLILLNETEKSIIDIALNVGFDTPSAFNKAFKKVTNINPTEFRNLGKEQKRDLIYAFSMTTKTKETIINFNMDPKPEIVNRKEMTVYYADAQGGDFKDIAQTAWEGIMKALATCKEDLSQSEFIGIGTMFTEDTRKVCDYKAAFSLPTNPNTNIPGLKKEKLPEAKYAKFLLKGSLDNLWVAFDKAFQVINEGPYEFLEAPCIENYLTDPQTTPTEDLRTEILIPIK